jgi:hypothetical protein
LTLIAAGAGLLFPDIYARVVRPDLVPGALSQDLISAVAGVSLLVLAASEAASEKGQP